VPTEKLHIEVRAHSVAAEDVGTNAGVAWQTSQGSQEASTIESKG